MLTDERKHELEHFNEIGQLSSPRARELFTEIDRLRAIADGLLCKTTDGVYYAAYDPQESNPPLWAVWRYGELEPWRVSKAKAPTTPDEVSTDFGLLIDDAEDQCIILGVFGTREAAEAARDEKEKTDG